MYIYKIHFHGSVEDMVVMCERTDRSLEVARQGLAAKGLPPGAIDRAVERANIAKLGCVTADIAHLYTEECVIIG